MRKLEVVVRHPPFSRLRLTALVLALLAGVMVTAQSARATTPGLLDTQFGVSGQKFMRWNHASSTRPSQVLIDSSGRTHTFLTVNPASGIPTATIVRRLSTGAIDSSFGTNGRLNDIPEAFNFGGTLLPSGKILMLVAKEVIATGEVNEMQLIRYSADGILDTTFGTNGIVSIPAGADRHWLETWADSNDNLRDTTRVHGAVKVQSDGSIIVVNNSYEGSIGDWNSGRTNLLRYSSTGQLDTTFGDAGKATLGVPNGGYTEFVDLAIDANDKFFVLANEYISPTSKVPVLFRLTANGALDSGFQSVGSTSGSEQLLIGQNRTAGSITLVGSSRILVTAMSGSDYSIAKYDYAGNLDTSFATNGIASYSPSGDLTSAPLATVVQPDGKILIGYGFNSNAWVARFTSAGTLDSSFGTNGSIEVGASTGMVLSMARQVNGNIIVASTEGYGDIWSIPIQQAVLRRITGSNGTLDTSFGQSGSAALQLDELRGYNDDSHVVTDSQGNIYVVSEWRPLFRQSRADYDEEEIVIYKVTANGEFDLNFGSRGIQSYSSQDVGWDIKDVAIDADNTMTILLGARGNNQASWIDVMRVLTDGSLDSNFLSQQSGFGSAVSITSSTDIYPERIAYAGADETYVIGEETGTAAIFKIRDDGTLDPSFDGDSHIGNGRVDINLGVGDETLNAVAIDRLGRIVIAGTNSPVNFVARLNTNGNFDQTFNGSGVREFNFSDQVTNIAYEAPEKIDIDPSTHQILIGNAISTNTQGCLNGIIRLNENGSLDSTFDGTSGNGNGRVLVMPRQVEWESHVMAFGRDTNKFSVVYQRNSGLYVLSLNSDGTTNTQYFADGLSHVSNGMWVRSLVQLSDGTWMGAGQISFNDDSSDDALFKLVAATTPTTSTTTTSTTITSTSTTSTTVPSVGQSANTTTSTTSTTVTTVPPVATTKRQPLISKTRKATFASVAAFAGMTVSKKDKVSLQISKASSKACVTSGLYLKGIKPGTCVVTVKVVSASTKKAKNKKVTLVIS